MTRDEWLDVLASELGVAPPSLAEIDALLDLAGTAAHASERQAAPLSCWLIGSVGLAPADAAALVRRLSERGAP